MPIRAFLTTWTIEYFGPMREIHNPIVDYLEGQPPIGAECTMFYPDQDANGVPDKTVIIVLVRSNQATGPELEQLGNLAGVRLIPPFRANKPMSEIPQSVKTNVEAAMQQYGIPLQILNNAVIFGDVVRGTLLYMSGSNAQASDSYFTQLDQVG